MTFVEGVTVVEKSEGRRGMMDLSRTEVVVCLTFGLMLGAWETEALVKLSGSTSAAVSSVCIQCLTLLFLPYLIAW